MQKEARSMVAAMASALSEEHVEELLGTMCDAVVRLDESLTIAPPSAKLDALLFRRTSSVGRSFPSLMDERDQPRFLDFVSPTGAPTADDSLGLV